MSDSVEQLTVRIPGRARTQGSAALWEGRMFKKDAEKHHRELAVWLMHNQWGKTRMFTGPVRVDIRAEFARPAKHYRSGRFAHLLTAAAPHSLHAQKPDADKIARLILDALTHAGVVKDDCQVAELFVEKRWVPRDTAEGTTVTVASIEVLSGEARNA